MKIGLAIIEGLVWSVLWMITVMVVVQKFPWLIEHDYPEDVRKSGDFSPSNEREKKKGALFAGISFFLLMSLLISAGVVHYKGESTLYRFIWMHLWIMCMMWNIVDLIILDWLMICTWEMRWAILPGSKGCPGNRDYRFHAIGFVKGFFVMSLMSLFFAGISYGIIQWIG
ncbi:MAG: hypothetical protein Q4D65_04080 [Peptostreptococcaceae bacterium]|nr:hypothetical protein [Peptostreptococcaceae bacterium]